MSWHPLDAPDNYSDREREGEGLDGRERDSACLMPGPGGCFCVLLPRHKGKCRSAGGRTWLLPGQPDSKEKP